MQDAFYNRQLIQNGYFTPILNIVYETMPRDNLLNSACLELFDFVKRENLKPLIVHLVEACRPKLQEITYVNVFQEMILRYDQYQGFNSNSGTTHFSIDGTAAPNRTPTVNGHPRYRGVKEMDATEEAYFNSSDEEDEVSPKPRTKGTLTNSVTTSPMLKSLVDYPDDDEDAMDTRPPEPGELGSKPSLEPSPMLQTPPPERLSDKRRREEDNEEDELGKLSFSKRRNSGSSTSSLGSTTGNKTLKRKKAFGLRSDGRDSPSNGAGVKKIEISFGGKKSGSQKGSEGDKGG